MTAPTPPAENQRRAIGITLLASAGVILSGVAPSTLQALLPVWWRPLHGVTLVWGLLLLWVMPRDRRGAVMLVAAACVRLSLFAPNIHLHTDKAYALMDEARGLTPPNVRYGDAYASFCSWVEIAWGFVPDASQRFDAVAGLLTAILVAQTVRRLTRDDGLAGIALLWMVLDPLHVAMSSTEERMVLATLLQAAFVAGAVRRDAPGDALAGVSAGLLAHTRPEQGLIAGLMVVALIAKRAWLGVGLATTLLVWRVWAWIPSMAELPLDASVLYVDTWWNQDRIAAWTGRDGAWVVLDPTRTPVGLCVLAAAAALRLPRDRRGGLWAALLVGGTLLYATQPAVADRLRFQLPVQAALVGLAALGLGRLSGAARGAALVGVLVTFLPARAPYPPFAWQVEYERVRHAVAEVPQGAVVRYDDGLDASHHFAEWAAARGGAQWLPLAAGVAPSDWRWVGATEFAVGHPAPDLAGRRAVVVETFTPDWGGLAHYGPWDSRPLTIGLYAPVGR